MSELLSEITSGGHPRTGDLYKAFAAKKSLRLKGLCGSANAMALASIIPKIPSWHLIILPDGESAAYFYNDLEKASGKKDLLFYPSAWKRSRTRMQIDEGNLILRTGVLEKLTKEKVNLVHNLFLNFRSALTRFVEFMFDFSSFYYEGNGA